MRRDCLLGGYQWRQQQPQRERSGETSSTESAALGTDVQPRCMQTPAKHGTATRHGHGARVLLLCQVMGAAVSTSKRCKAGSAMPTMPVPLFPSFAGLPPLLLAFVAFIPYASAQTPSPPMSPMWAVDSGSSYCQLTNGDQCFTDGAGSHGNNERCTVRALQPLFATSTTFHTENYFDYLTIHGTRYMGTNGPLNVQMAVGYSLLVLGRFRHDGRLCYLRVLYCDRCTTTTTAATVAAITAAALALASAISSRDGATASTASAALTATTDLQPRAARASYRSMAGSRRLAVLPGHQQWRLRDRWQLAHTATTRDAP